MKKTIFFFLFLPVVVLAGWYCRNGEPVQLPDDVDWTAKGFHRCAPITTVTTNIVHNSTNYNYWCYSTYIVAPAYGMSLSDPWPVNVQKLDAAKGAKVAARTATNFLYAAALSQTNLALAAQLKIILDQADQAVNGVDRDTMWLMNVTQQFLVQYGAGYNWNVPPAQDTTNITTQTGWVPVN